MRLKAEKNASFDEFTSLIFTLLKAAWGPKWGTFVHAYPNGTEPDKTDLPIITYYSKSKRPGLVGKDTREIKPRFRETLYEVDGKEEACNVHAQVFEHDVIFDIWAQTNVEADKLANKFEDFMMTYTGYFLQKGVQKLVFVEQTDTTEENLFVPDKVIVRSFRYLVHLEKQVVTPVSLLKEVIGQVEVLTEDEASDSIDEFQHFNINKGGN